MKRTIILALISTLLMVISFLLLYYHTTISYHGRGFFPIYFLIGGFWLLFQFIAIYMDFANYERHRKKFVEVGLLGWLIGGWHVNARFMYITTALYPFLGLLVFDLAMFSGFSYFGTLFGISVEFGLYSFENDILILWGFSSALNVITGVLATPPRKRKYYKKTCIEALYHFLRKNHGKAFSVNALTNKIENFEITTEKRTYCKKHIQDLLSSLKSDGKIDSVVKNDELFFVIPKEWAL